MMSLCYVGQHDRATLTTMHKLFGLVATCPRHDPHPHGYGLPFPFKTPAHQEQPPAQVHQEQRQPPAQGGARVTVPVRPTPPAPPSNAALLGADAF